MKMSVVLQCGLDSLIEIGTVEVRASEADQRLGEPLAVRSEQHHRRVQPHAVRARKRGVRGRLPAEIAQRAVAVDVDLKEGDSAAVARVAAHRQQELPARSLAPGAAVLRKQHQEGPPLAGVQFRLLREIARDRELRLWPGGRGRRHGPC